MTTTRRAALAALLAGATALCAPFAATAQSGETITIVVPYAGGGFVDGVVRRIADGMSTELGQPVIVENRPGANGIVGSQYVARANPDGLTLLAGGTGPISLNTMLRPTLPYGLDSFDSVAMLFDGSLSITVPASIGVSTLEDFATWAHEQDHPMRYATLGPGSVTHLYGLLLAEALDIEVVDVAYRNNPDSVLDLVGGQQELNFATPASLIGQANEGNVTIIALTLPERSAQYPDIPTVVELGHPDLVASFWTALHAPAGTPEDVIARLSAAAVAAMANPEVQTALTNAGLNVNPGGPEMLDAQLARDAETWGQVISQHNIVLTD